MADNSTLIKVAAIGGALYLAYTQGWLSSLGIGTAASTGTPVASTTPAASSVPVTTATAPVQAIPAQASAASNARSLDTIYAAMLALATAAGTTSTGVDGWGYYLNQVPGIVAPDPIPPFSAAIANFDRSQNMSAAQYWAVIAPVLKTQYGLSGLGVYGGLGALVRRYR